MMMRLWPEMEIDLYNGEMGAHMEECSPDFSLLNPNVWT
jgi:hypothetical protein